MMDPLFEVHLLNEAGIAKASEMAVAFDDLIIALRKLCPEGREFSICRTKLEEASFFAKKSIALLPVNQRL